MKTLQIISITAWLIVGVLALDAFAFGAWIASGQHPVDNFYAGSITAHALAAVIK